MIGVWCAASALAADAWWVGAWGLDPSKSDDPSALVDRAIVARPASSGSTTTRGLAPDGGEENDAEEAMRKARFDAMAILARSGRLSLGPTADGLVLDWGDGPVAVHGTKWTKARDADGDPYRVRVGIDDEVLVVQRRFKSTTLTESWLPPEADADPRTRVVVVVIAGPTLVEDVEFRRIYRKLD
jgi:hypothetical protein